MSNTYDRHENESFLDYADRLIDNYKMYDLDRVEIYDILFDEMISSDESRKRLYGARAIIDKLKEEGFEKLTEDEMFKKLETKKMEIKSERVKLSTVRNDLNKKITEMSRRELLVEEVLNVIPKVEKVDFKPLIQQDDNKSYMLNFSDIHYDYFFLSENNEYSIDILKERFNKLLGELVKTIEKEKISLLTVVNCGDSINGLIRISQLQTMRLGVVQSVVSFSRFMGDWLNELSKHVEIIYRHVPTSNHSQLRIFDKGRFIGGEDLELLIVNYIHDYLANNDRVKVDINLDNEYITFNLQGYKIIAFHGHQFRKSDNVLEKINTVHRKFYDTIIFGHWHSSYEKTLFEGVDNNVELLVSPSIVGSDPYSDSLLVGAKSSAKLHIYEKGKGRVQAYNYILN